MLRRLRLWLLDVRCEWARRDWLLYALAWSLSLGDPSVSEADRTAWQERWARANAKHKRLGERRARLAGRMG